MVCQRCISTVKKIMAEIDAGFISVRLGEVLLEKSLKDRQLQELNTKLKASGFELLDDSRKQQIDKVKSIVIEHVHHMEDAKFIFSSVLSKALNREYSVISKLFSEIEGITIEQYIILQKIEKVKELLVYNQMTLNEISYQLGYSNVAHLSAQFKKVTGLTPTQFKAQGINLRKTLDNL